jgi:serine/threonine protein kinase
MEILCTRPGCSHPRNFFADLDLPATLKTVQQKYCTSCGMPLILAGRYLPSRLLGQGGFGAAFLARDRYTPTMRSCVVKQFQPSGPLNPKQLEMAQGLFEREAEVLEQLGNRHPQIPDLYAFFPLIVSNTTNGQEERFFYLVQELIDGQTLEEELAAQGPFSEAAVRFILEEILKVLQFVHQNGSIHRDIKPSNIMRDREGRLHLLDFGAVKQVTSGVGNSPQGGSTGIYSLGFAPPEQMAGSQVYPSTDLYALAATCLNLLTGRKTEELYDSYRNTWNWKPYAPQVSDRFEKVLNRMLLSTPSDRFQSAEAVLNALTPSTLAQPVQKPSGPQSQPTIASQTSPSSALPLQKPAPQPSQASMNPSRQSRRRPFSELEILGGAAFIGFEGTLLLIALGSLLPAPEISLGLWGMGMGGLIFAQYCRIIEKIDLILISGASLGLVWFIPALHQLLLTDRLKIFLETIRYLPSPEKILSYINQLGIINAVVLLSLGTAVLLVFITTFFRLIYQLLSRLL